MQKNINATFYERFGKRIYDILFSSISLVLLFPIILFLGLLVKISSKGPAIFKTKRVGFEGKDFYFYKFRSMRIDAPKDIHPKYLDSAKYVTKIGSFLRNSSLDELPQLYCVFIGTMSIVGPRPSGKSESELNILRKETGVFNVKPGITGFAQINGRNKLALNDYLKNEFDLKYISKISFFNDLKIIFQTIIYVLIRKDIIH